MNYNSIDDIIQKERHRRFTNRETEVELFQKLILPDNSYLRILIIYGEAGIGKSELLSEYERLCSKWDVPYIKIDGYAQKNILELLNRLRQQAGNYSPRHHFNEFDHFFYLYLKMQKTVLKDEDLVAKFRRVLERDFLDNTKEMKGSFSINQKKSDIEKQVHLLSTKLSMLQEQKIVETRAEEAFRIDYEISKLQAELQRIEAYLTDFSTSESG
jgi:AAA15 family ATPase/GTPase